MTVTEAQLAGALQHIAVALGAVLDVATAGSQAAGQHHARAAEARIQALWLARGELTDPSAPVEEPVEPQASDAERMAEAGQRFGVSVGDALAGTARISEGVRSLGPPAGTLFGVQAGDGLDAERADAATAIGLVRLLAENRAMVRGLADGRNVLIPADTVELTAEQVALLARLTPSVTAPLPEGGTSDDER